MTESSNNQVTGQGKNPAWDEFFNAIPEDYREDVQPLVEPVLQKWDQGVQKQFEAYNPYKKYVDEKVDPQVMDYAMNLLDTLNDNDGALQVFQQLGSYLEQQGLLGQEEKKDNAGASTNEGTDEIDWNTLPPALKRELEQLQEGFSTLAQDRINERNKQIEAEEDALLDAELKSLRDRYGDYDEHWVMAKMLNGVDPEDAVKQYNQWLDNTLKARNKPSPSFRALGAGSGDFPSGSGEFNPRKATGREVQDMIAQKLMDLQRDK